MSNSIKKKKKKVWKHNKICETQAKVLLRGKFISPSACIRKKEKSRLHDLSSHFENSEKEEQNKPKASQRKEDQKSVIYWKEKSKGEKSTKQRAGSLRG